MISRSIALVALMVAFGGCAAISNVSKYNGLSLDEVKAKLGPPPYSGSLDEPSMGVRPRLVKPGDHGVFVYYRGSFGSTIILFAVPPEAFQRINGVLPGQKTHYVIEGYRVRKGIVF